MTAEFKLQKPPIELTDADKFNFAVAAGVPFHASPSDSKDKIVFKTEPCDVVIDGSTIRVFWRMDEPELTVKYSTK